MLYYSEFTSLNGHNYKVELKTSTGTGSRKLILGDTPFVTSMDADGKSLYAPIKSSGATVQILTSDVPFDIYSSKPNEVKVTLTDTDTSKVVWIGYLTPCAYSQGFDENLEYVEFECVDGIAVLKDMLYVALVRDIKSFLQIVIKCLEISGCYKTLYVTDNMYLSNYPATCLLEKLTITEQNFFDIKDDEAQGDDDVAWSAYDVLFEICQYLGYTLITEGEDVYILDYDAIKKKQNHYWKYNLTVKNPIGTKITLQHSYKITGDSHAATGTNVSLTEVFNKITVVSDFYEIKNLAGDIESSSNLVNITATSDTTLKNWQNNNSNFLTGDVFTVKNGAGQDESFFITINKDAYGNPMFVMGKFYKNKLITHKHYLHNASRTLDFEANYNPMKYSKLWDAKGSIYVAYFTKRVSSKDYNRWRVNYPANWDSLTSDQKLTAYQGLMLIGNIQSKSLTKMILLVNHPTNHIEWNECAGYPFCTISSSQTISSVGGDGAYLLLKGSVIRHEDADNPYPMNGDAPRNSNHKKSFIWANEGFVIASLKWGNLWWHDENAPGKSEGYWDTTEGRFKILYIPPDQNSGGMGDWYDKELKFYNTAGLVWGADKEGYYIPCPDSGNLTGSPELTFYAPYDSDLKQVRGKGQKDRKHKRCYLPRVLMLKGIELTANYADDAMNQEAKSAKTCYTNVVEGYCKEAEELKFKICTADNKNSSYSLVSYSLNGDDTFVDTVIARSSGLTLRPEEQFVNDYVSQYEDPHVIFECNLKLNCNVKPYSILTDTTLSKRDFIIDTMNYDYKQDSVELSIIEKA